MSDSGCIYVAFGRPYLIQALHSFRSLRATNPSVPVCILTNVLPDAPRPVREWDQTKDTWVYIDAANEENRLFKTDLPRYTPFKKTLFLDSDTEVIAEISGMFDMLDYWDVALRLNDNGISPKKLKGRQRVLDGKELVANLPHWNSGVVLFRSGPKADELFSLWSQYFKAGGIPYDQVALVEAAFRSSCRILSLDSRWNGRDWAPNSDQRRYILHYTFHIDDRLARSLNALDQEIFGEVDEEGLGEWRKTVDFISRRQQAATFRKKGGGGRLWALFKRRVIRLARRVGRG